MDSLKIAVTWFGFGAVIGIALMLQPVIAPILPKDPGDRLVYVFNRGLMFAGGEAAAVELADSRNGLIVENLSFSKDLDGREIGFSVDRLALQNVMTERLVDLYLGREEETENDIVTPQLFAGGMLLEGLELRTGQDILYIKSMTLRNVGTDNYRHWFDPETFRSGSYASVLAFLVLTGTAEAATAEEVFFRNGGTVPISASIDAVEASNVTAGQVGYMKFKNAVAQWRVGNGVTMQTVTLRTVNAREIVSAAAGHDNDIDAPEALIFDLAEFEKFSLHTPDIEILRIPKGKVGTYTQLGRIPVSARLELSQMSLEVDALESRPVREYLRDIGVGAIAADASFAYIFDRTSGLLTIKDGAIRAQDLATIDLSAELSGIMPSWDAIADFVDGLQQSQIVGAQARIEDHSIVERLSAKWVRDTSRPPQEIIASFTMSGGGDAAAASKVGQAASALRDFIGAPDTLTISVSPEAPVPVATLFTWTSPESFFETLAIDIAIESPASGQILPN